MGRFFTSLVSLVIPTAGGGSNSYTLPDDCEKFTLYSPAALTTAVTVQVSPDGTNFFPLTPVSGGTAITIAVSLAIPFVNHGYKSVRVSSAGAEAAARTFLITCQNQN